MLLDIRPHDLDIVGAVHRHLEKRVRAVLGRSATRVRMVTLGLSDVNGPRGGADMHCAVNLELTPRGSVRAEAIRPDLFSAVDLALGRARRALRETQRERRGESRVSRPGTHMQ